MTNPASNAASPAKVKTDPAMSFGFTCTVAEHLEMPAFHQHSEIEIGFTEYGSNDAYWGDRMTHVPQSRIGVSWAMVPHRSTQTSETTRCYVVNLPLPWFLSWRLPAPFVSAVMRGWPQYDPHPSRWRHDLRAFKQWHEEINSGDAERQKTALLDIEVRLRRLAFDIEQAGVGEEPTWVALHHGESPADMGKVEQMASLIAANYHRNLKVAEIARAAGLHENYAMQLFRRACGITLLQYITQHRVWHAQRLLTTTDMKMIDIAMAAGFGSDNRFYALFKRVCGISPREYRASIQSSVSSPASQLAALHQSQQQS